MSIDLLNPAFLGKQMIKSQLEAFKDELPKLIEDFLFDFAEKDLLNPFELIIFIHAKDGVPHGDVVLSEENKKRKKIGSLELEKFLQEQDFLEKLSMLPENLQAEANEFIKDRSIQQIVTEHLEDKTYIINFDQYQEIQFLEKNKQKLQNLNLDKVFNEMSALF